MIRPSSCLVLFCCSMSALAQQWTFSPAPPTARSLAAFVYQAHNGRMLLFGGGNDQFQRLGDTWDFDGTTWRQVTQAPLLPHEDTPSARWGHAMAYDAARAQVVLFGGIDADHGNRADTWTFDGISWRKLLIAGPSGRSLMSMAYDSARSRSVLFGGLAGIDTLGDTWEFDGAQWSRITTIGAPTGGRLLFAMAYDAARGRTVLFGGVSATAVSLGDTWEFDGRTWQQVLTATGPSDRLTAGMAFDVQRGRMLLFGGFRFDGSAQMLGDTWEYDGAWHPVVATGSPQPRSSHVIAYDLQRGRTVMFSGVDDSSRIPGAWEYQPAAIASWTPYGQGCNGTHGAPTLGAPTGAVPALGSTFVLQMGSLPVPPAIAFLGFSLDLGRIGGSPLPMDLGPSGLPSCKQWIGALALNPAVLLHTGTATYPLAIPAAIELRGLAVGAQALVFDLANGMTMSNAAVLRLF